MRKSRFKTTNFTDKLEENNTTMFFIIEKSEETAFNFSKNFLNIM